MPHVHVHVHTNDAFEEGKHPRGTGGKFSVVKEGSRAPRYHVVHQETKHIYHTDPTANGARQMKKAIEENPKFGPSYPLHKWNGSHMVPA